MTFPTFLSTVAPPVLIKIPPSFVEVLLGESLTLSCGAFGNPKPKVIWRKDDNTVEEEDKFQVVQLNKTLLKRKKAAECSLLMCEMLLSV